MTQERIIRYWHAVELLQPQAAPRVQKRDHLYSSFIHSVNVDAPVMPWSTHSPVSRQRLPKKRIWSHTLFAHIYDSKDVANELESLYGADQGYREPPRRESALFSLKFTADGYMVQDSLVISSEAWFLGCVLSGRDWTYGFEEDQRALRKRAAERMGGIVTAQMLRKLTDEIRCALRVDAFFDDGAVRKHRFRSTPVNPKNPEPEDDPLNSFILSDLAGVAANLARGVNSAPFLHTCRTMSQAIDWT